VVINGSLHIKLLLDVLLKMAVVLNYGTKLKGNNFNVLVDIHGHKEQIKDQFVVHLVLVAEKIEPQSLKKKVLISIKYFL
jgi:hypothetical protein